MSDSNFKFNIKIVGTTGISYMIPTESSEKIKDLKLKLSEKVGISSQVYDLSFHGKILLEDKQLNFYEICSGDVLHCIENTLGGKFKIK